MYETLNTLLDDLAATHTDRPALTQDDRTVTFLELHSAALAVSAALSHESLRAGDRIAILDKNSIDYYELLFGGVRGGVVVIGLNYRLSAREITSILADSGAKALFVAPEFLHLIDGVRETIQNPPRVVVLDDDYASWRDAPHPEPTPIEVIGDDVAIQLYSSGTTGLPKGAMLNHRSLMFTPEMGRDYYRMTEHSANLLTSPLFHIGGTGYQLATFGLGGHTVLVRDVVPTEMLALIERHSVTNMFLVPSVIDMLLKAQQSSPADMSSLRLIAYGGAPMTSRLLAEAVSEFGCSVMAVYGMTETAGTVTCLLAEEHDPSGQRSHLLGSIGRPFPWHEVVVHDPVTGTPAPIGVVGELWVRSEQNMTGYWNNPEATTETLDSEGWLHTGDAALVDEDGYLYLKDRLKDMIISGGENIYPAEVENVLVEHPDVGDVVVIGVSHEKWGETVKACVVAAPGAHPNEAELIEFCRTRLARYKCPTSVDLYDSLPKNASGKVLKRMLRENYRIGSAV
jgi:acyl-CoA synthetase (AMP-forming)/AMP-acid ligase II